MARDDSRPDGAASVPLWIGLAGAVVVGLLTATQSRVNSQLAQELGDGYLASVISFGSGLVILLVALAGWKPGRVGMSRLIAEVRHRRTPWWYLCGGVAGALFVLSQGLTGAVLGVALFTIAIVCGQTVSGLVVDRVGFGTMLPSPVTATRLAGSLLALVAVGWAVSAQVRSDIPLWMLVLPLIAGIGLGWQQAANGQVRVIAQSALAATTVNFIAGSVVLITASLVHSAIVGWPDALPTTPWLYLGGLIGALFIGLGTIVVKRTGVLLLGLGAIAGQLVTSVLLDLVFPIAGRVMATSTVVGVALALVAVVVAAVPSRPVGRAPGAR